LLKAPFKSPKGKEKKRKNEIIFEMAFDSR
jgi:hypothetical protein